MTQPRDIDHRDVSPVALVSADAWEQTSPVGGEDVDGHPASYAKSVTVAGLVTVREVPSLACAAGSIVLAANQVTQLVGRTPQRRCVTITLSAAGILALDENGCTNNNAFILPANLPFPTSYAGAIYVKMAAGGTASYWSEIDNG